jgi:hypothetical protein
MITLNVFWFLLMLAAALSFGAWAAWHIYGVNNDQNENVARFMRGVAVNDEAENGEQR